MRKHYYGAIAVFIISVACRVSVNVAPDASEVLADVTGYSTRPPVYFPDPTGIHPQVQVHVPAGYVPTSAYPLVLFLCGSGSCAAYEGWWPIAAHEVVYAMPLSSLTPGIDGCAILERERGVLRLR